MKNVGAYTRADIEYRYASMMKTLLVRPSFARSFLHDGKYRDLVSLLGDNITVLEDRLSELRATKEFFSRLRG